MVDLEKQLQQANSDGARFKIIVTDGVFSMDGLLAPLDAICNLADQYDALVMIDECHAAGFIGKTGRGTLEEKLVGQWADTLPERKRLLPFLGSDPDPIFSLTL